MMVSIAETLYTNDIHHIGLEYALERIATGKSKEKVEELRSLDSSERGRVKKNLPIVMFSGTFTGRKDELLKDHSGYIVLDFDNLDNVEQAKQSIGSDKYVYSCWVSPSGNGLKALVRVTNPERHRDHFRSLTSYFEKQYGIEVDPSGINESRACFESYDPDIIVNSSYDRFGGMLSEKSQNQVMVKQENVTDYYRLNLAATMVRNSQDGERHAVLFKAARLCGGYIAAGRIEEEEAIRVLVREFSRRDYDEHYNPNSTVRDGIEVGKQMPLSEIAQDEKDARRKLQVEEGDMSFISSGDEDFKWITAFANGEIQIGLDTGNKELDKHFRYKKDFTIINGHSNVGKTTLAMYLMVNASIRHGWKWVIYSSENRTASIKMKLLQFLVDRPIGAIDYQTMRMAYSWVEEHFVIINNKEVVSYADLIVYAEIMIANDEHFDGFFIDPYNSLRITISNNNIGVHQYHYEAASEFLTFTTAHDKAVWLNTHAVTEAQRRKGTDGLPMAPYAEDTEGGGLFVNRSDNFLTFHRKIQHEDPEVRRTMEFHVRKVRETETGGGPTPLINPVMFKMNTSNTGFYCLNGEMNLFEPKTFQPEPEQTIDIPFSIDPDDIF
jgi:hypothetical protein